jgi:hypothetical protein
MGGSWWQDVWLEYGDDSRGACQAIVDGWRSRIERDTGYRTAEIPVADKWSGAPDYHLMLLTDHDHGLWVFNEACSYAMRDYRAACDKVQPQLELLPPLTAHEPEWIDEIASSVRALVDAGVTTTVCSAIPQVFGASRGLARQMHLRTALKRLYREGLLADEPKGDLTDYVIRRPLRQAG